MIFAPHVPPPPFNAVLDVRCSPSPVIAAARRGPVPPAPSQWYREPRKPHLLVARIGPVCVVSRGGLPIRRFLRVYRDPETAQVNPAFIDTRPELHP